MPAGMIAASIAVGLVALNVWLLRANRKTPVPKDCENMKPDCEACGLLDCEIRNLYKENKVEEGK
ncbi:MULTISPECIES: hypothetical protein [Terrabacteria group]|uniref:hypothetical protein n=1 Tax=Bacillati TaxID=1783272 RepID=UPI001C6F187B|nr:MULTISPECIES: hypothetical protein [Terrabacteria group]MBW9212148.1 hypothetical protein [Trueperella sp. zg.1013]